MRSYLDWKVGDRVVCIDADWSGGGLQAKMGVSCPLVLRCVYTIAEFAIQSAYGIDGRLSDHVVVVLREVRHPGGVDAGFDARRFRKVQPRKTSIARFEAILHGARVPEDA